MKITFIIELIGENHGDLCGISGRKFKYNIYFEVINKGTYLFKELRGFREQKKIINPVTIHCQQDTRVCKIFLSYSLKLDPFLILKKNL